MTRVELVDHIETAFDTGPASRSTLLEAAAANHARPEVIALLEQLPDIPYRTLRDLWPRMADVPVGA